jgi:TonB family protein
LHVAAIYGFASGFVTQVFTAVLPHPIKGVVLDPPAVPIQPLTPLRLVLPTFVTVVPLPQLPNLDLPPPLITGGEVSIVVPASTAVPQSERTEVTRVAGGPGSGFPNTRDYYPAGSIRAEEAGVAAVRVCVDRNGRLTSDPVIFESSGYRRLDGGALALARAGSGHYRSTLENGTPVTDCYPFRIRFELQSLH